MPLRVFVLVLLTIVLNLRTDALHFVSFAQWIASMHLHFRLMQEGVLSRALVSDVVRLSVRGSQGTPG